MLGVTAVIVAVVVIIIICLLMGDSNVEQDGLIVINIPIDKYNAQIVESKLTITTIDNSIPATQISSTDKEYVIYVPMRRGGRVVLDNTDGSLTGCDMMKMRTDLTPIYVRKVTMDKKYVLVL